MDRTASRTSCNTFARTAPSGSASGKREQRLQFGDSARENLDAISHFIEDDAGADVADAFLNAVAEKCARLVSLPGTLGTARPELGHAFRSTPFKGYVIYFRYGPNTLEVIGVLDARRDALAYFTDEDPET